MRLVFVHGINQQTKSEDVIRREWIGALEAGLGQAGRFDKVEVVTPFYGDALAALTDPTAHEDAIAQGIGEEDEDEREFVVSSLQQIALDAGLTDAQINKEQAVAQGLPHDRRFIAIIRLLESLSPFQGRIALRILKQAYAYLKRKHVSDVLDAIVEPVLADGACVVVAHSLGTVISFKLLRKTAQTVPLFVTLGSPLAVLSVQAALRKPRRVPLGVKHWFNALDVDDFITLGRGLTAETFAGGIENRTEVDNGDDAHSITAYLRDPVVRQMISTAV
ncbi:MAG TPA: hypothetical protein VH988_28135 [Thermoanaerobaculia bacterium]|jgi:hypothetical protein|nr:hypothetical protein [Thermoanaerobaculia bacterium]